MTLVVLMGLASRGRIAEALVRQGWPRWMPAAVVLAASSPRQRVWRGTLRDLPDAPVDAKRDGPGVIVIGEVAAFAEAEAVGQSFAAAIA
jgi:siroheme synthase